MSDAEDSLARMIFEACRAEGVLNDIRGWDERNSTEQYAGSTWKTHHPGLREKDKDKWRRIAARLEERLP